MSRRQQRLLGIAVLAVGLSLAAVLTLTAFRKNLMSFHTPSDLVATPPAPGVRMRLGGLVEPGSLQRGSGLEVRFTLADCTHRLAVRYDGILPDLFREGQGVVATGSVDTQQVFVADEILAKHDENYIPPQLAESLTTSTGHSCAPFKPVGREG